MTKQTLVSLPYYRAEELFRTGQMTDRDWRRYRMAWHWGAVRFTSDIQYRYKERHGDKATVRRINRMRYVIGQPPHAHKLWA